jgi:SAM-dependent methyltransferase
VEFHCIDIADLPEGDFDLMTSKDTFEHVMDLPKVLCDMRERLKSGGRLYAAIGPLWNSPFGDHDTIKRLIGVNLPWAHLWIPDQVVLQATAKRLGKPIYSYRDLGMNMLAFRDYRRIIYESGFVVEFFQPNCSGAHLQQCRRLPHALWLRVRFKLWRRIAAHEQRGHRLVGRGWRARTLRPRERNLPCAVAQFHARCAVLHHKVRQPLHLLQCLVHHFHLNTTVSTVRSA